MKKTKILMTRSLLSLDQQYIIDGLRERVGDVFELLEPPSYDEDGLISVVEEADVLLGPYVSKRILEKGINIKLIQVPWTGMDTFDFNVMAGFNIPVCNSHSNSAAVAELGVTMVADLLKKVSYHDRKMRTGSWNREQKPLGLRSQMIANQTICFLGYGNIGRKMGKILSGFGAKILSVTEHEHEFEESSNFLIQDIMKVVSCATVIVNTLPLTDKTRGIINKKFINRLKPCSYLINVSRAEIIDEDALYEALKNGHLSGFASDVWWNAPKRGESQSWSSTHNKFEEMDQVILSPHRAGFVEKALPHLDDVIVNLANFIKGEHLINVVDIYKMF